MMKWFHLLIFFATVFAQKSWQGLVQLNSYNWNEYVNGENSVFVKFYAPWCGHCQDLAPHYERLAEYFRGESRIIVAEINIDQCREMIGRHGLRGVPTLKFFPQGSTIGEEAHCGHTFESMCDYIKEKLDT